MKVRTTPILAMALACAFAAAGCTGTVNVEAELEITCDGPCLCENLECSCEDSGDCNFGGDAEVPDGASFECPFDNSCNIQCGLDGDVKCAGNSTCVIDAGEGTVVECEDSSCDCQGPEALDVTCTGNSDCSLTLGAGSEVLCTGNSSCVLDCPSGECDIQCEGSATCQVLGCLSGDCNLLCDDGDAIECADGGLACPGECTAVL